MECGRIKQLKLRYETDLTNFMQEMTFRES
jgi:hypothetical protein